MSLKTLKISRFIKAYLESFFRLLEIKINEILGLELGRIRWLLFILKRLKIYMNGFKL